MVIDLQARKCVIHIVVKSYFDNRKTKQRGGTDTGFFLRRVHRDLDRSRYEFFHLLCTAPGPLRDDGNRSIGYIGESVDTDIFEADIAANSHQSGHKEYEIFILQ